MGTLIEDYAMIGDRETVALVSREGSIDWLCVPRFDSGACFSALLGGPEHGRWIIRPDTEIASTRRRYRGNTLVLETEFTTTGGGRAAIIDFMPARDAGANVVRIVEGRSGRVPMHMEMTIRFDYGSIVPWLQRIPPAHGMVESFWVIGGRDGPAVESGVPLTNRDFVTKADFEVTEGQRILSS
jgi:GH15 family glucan-1,4-alpha-glucosidase